MTKSEMIALWTRVQANLGKAKSAASEAERDYWVGEAQGVLADIRAAIDDATAKQAGEPN